MSLTRAPALLRTEKWSPASWKSKEIHQAPEYSDPQSLFEVEQELLRFPNLVSENEVAQLKEKLARVSRGEAFLLQGGDCAESFADFSHEQIQGTASLLKSMSSILSASLQKPVVILGRLAGQFAKPRSSAQEIQNGQTLPTFRGDLINGPEFDSNARRACPHRMKTAYFQSAATLNLLRGLKSDPVYTSHEALLLPYEQSLVRPRYENEGFYSSSAHFLWIGDRTRQLEGAHVEFARGISNPIGLKCGPELKTDDLIRLVQKLNPSNQSGKLTLIPRIGARLISTRLAPLVRAIQREGLDVLWVCDPMHANTYSTAQGFKTRSFECVLLEAQSFFEIHRAEGSIAGGLHLEMTNASVIECTGGSAGIVDRQILPADYKTLCDPRLNSTQALEFATKIASFVVLPK